ncbi:MAG: CRISPR-associated endonuclease Cas1 [Acidobacteriota bacterium]
MDGERVFIPISKLNTFVYCPRRFFYEFIEGEERRNEFIEDGAQKHQAVNEEAYGLKRGDKTISRQVYVASEKLGVSGYADLIEEENGVVRPIEYKRGHLGDWLNDKVQLCAEALCVEELRGISVSSGDLFYIGSHRRKEVAFDQALRSTTLDIISRAHDLVAHPAIPPALDNNRCNGCSIRPICLPAETALLQAQGDGISGQTGQTPSRPSPEGAQIRPRRPVPSLGMEHVLYVDTQGAYIRKTDERLVVAKREDGAREEVLRDLPAINVDQVVLGGNVGFTTPALRFLLGRGIPVVFMSAGGNYEGTLVPEFSRNSILRIAQHRASSDIEKALPLARQFVTAKLANMRSLLLRYNRTLQSPSVHQSITRIRMRLQEVDRATGLEQLLGIEGNGSSDYFRVFGELLKSDVGFSFEKRSRRPPRDPVNALLSFAYALLSKDMISTIATVGLDPYVGFYHQPKYGRPCLALDLMEEMRPIVADSVVLTFVNNGMVSPNDSETREGGVYMNETARKRFYRLYEQRKSDRITHPVFSYRLPYRRAMELQARILAKYLSGEIDSYYPLVVR